MGLSLFVLNQKKNFILINVILIMSLILGSVFIVFKFKEDSLRLTRDALQAVLHQSYNSYNLWLDRQISINKSIAASNQLSRLITSLKTQDTKDVRKKIMTKLYEMSEKGMLDGYQIISTEGLVLMGTGLTSNKVWAFKETHPDVFKKAISGQNVIIPPSLETLGSTPYDGAVSERSYVILFLSPIYDEHHQQIAIFSSIVSIDKELSDIISGGRISQTGETYLLNDQGRMLSKSRYQDELRQRGLLGPNEDTSGRLELRNPGPERVLTSNQRKIEEFPLTYMASEVSQHRSGYNMSGYRDYRGTEVFGVWLWDHRSSIGITTEIDTTEASKIFNSMALANLFLVCLLLGAAIFMMYLISSGHKAREEHLIRVRESLERKVKKRTAELENALTQIKVQADFDCLTQIANRRVFEETYDKAWSICERNQKHLGVLLIDVDFFKNYNDNYGHQAGDKCLVEIATAINNTGLLNRPLDIVARYGGEEFVILLTDTTPTYVYKVAEKVREAVEDLALEHQYRNDRKNVCTVSIGALNTTPNRDITKEVIIQKTDKSLYLAKLNGRNRIEISVEENQDHSKLEVVSIHPSDTNKYRS